MKSKGFTYLHILVIAGAIAVGVGAYFVSNKNDSPVEQAAEAVLHTQGVDIDFSPDDCDNDECTN